MPGQETKTPHAAGRLNLRAAEKPVHCNKGPAPPIIIIITEGITFRHED